VEGEKQAGTLASDVESWKRSSLESSVKDEIPKSNGKALIHLN